MKSHGLRCNPKSQGEDQEPILPTRVLDIGGNGDRVYLRTSNGRRAHYLCLSYCWGRADFIKATQRTVSSLENGLDMDCFPPVFQEFFRLARFLEIRHVWIDALCIMQDSADDWLAESGKMAQFYGNAILTVAATGCRNPFEELIDPHGQWKLTEQLASRWVEHKPWRGAPSPSFPLLKRGWCMQERYLSPRLLQFGPQQLFWDCASSSKSESQVPVQEKDFVDKSYFFEVCRTPPRPNVGWDMVRQNVWRKLVVQYSANNLTKQSDKLLALSGLADVWQQACRQQYFAGLWGGSLLVDLLWYSLSFDEEEATTATTSVEGPIDPATPRQEEWRAPSWSWAAMDGPVTYSEGWYVPVKRGTENTFHASAKIVAAECVPVGSSLTGKFKSGYIELDARVCDRDRCPPSDYCKFDPKVSEEAKDARVLVYLGMGGHTRSPSDTKLSSSYELLMLTPVGDSPGTYRRIGVVSCPVERWNGLVYLPLARKNIRIV
jgi:hypothetical protein